ncbi:uncharacterized, partial [Tachysurus ichikawai]
VLRLQTWAGGQPQQDRVSVWGSKLPQVDELDYFYLTNYKKRKKSRWFLTLSSAETLKTEDGRDRKQTVTK